MSDETYRVLYKDPDGHEQLTAAMTLDQANSRARDLEAQGHAVGSVMGDIAARGYMHARYAPTYRGVKVPDGLRADGAPRSGYEAWKRGVDASLDGAPRPPHYRGVPVSKVLRDNWGTPQAMWWRAGVDAALDSRKEGTS